MSLRLLTWVFQHSPATGNDRLVLLAVADEADDDGRNAYPSQQRIADKSRLSKRTTQRCLDRLEAIGSITVERIGKGRGYFNNYTVIAPDFSLNGRQSDVLPTEEARQSVAFPAPEEGRQSVALNGHEGRQSVVDPDPVSTPERRVSTPERRAVLPNLHQTPDPADPSPEKREAKANSELRSDEYLLEVASFKSCRLLADLLVANGRPNPPTITAKWLDDAEKIMRIDGYTFEDVEGVLRWALANDFWKAHIQSPAKLREKFEQLRLGRQNEGKPPSWRKPDNTARNPAKIYGEEYREGPSRVIKL